MKLLQRAAIAISLVVSASVPSIAQQPAASTAPKYPDSGTYFIISALNDQAMQAAAASFGQSVFLQEWTQSGMQKWTITRKIDPATKKPTNRYTIRLAGETPGLNFQPHPVCDSTAIISMDTSVFVLEPGDAGFLVKSVAKNGDAMYCLPQPPSNTEARFGPNDGSTKFRWKFVSAN